MWREGKGREFRLLSSPTLTTESMSQPWRGWVYAATITTAIIPTADSRGRVTSGWIRLRYMT